MATYATSSRRVLERDESPAGPLVGYIQPNEDDPARPDTVLYLTAADDVELGSPEHLTITIEPGDQLNPKADLDEEKDTKE